MIQNEPFLAELHPAFALRVWAFLGRMAEHGYAVKVTHGYRTLEQQAELYAAFRAGRGGKAAKPGFSFHNYRLAVDCIPFLDVDHDRLLVDGELSWDASQPQWKAMASAADAIGLTHGRSFGDWPHLEWSPNLSIRDLALGRVKLVPGHWGPWSY